MNLAESLHRETSAELEESRKILGRLVKYHGRLYESRGRLSPSVDYALVREAIVFERLTILEAAGQSPEQMAEMMEGMLMSARKLAARIGSANLSMNLDTLETPSAEELDAMSIDKRKLQDFRKRFVQVSLITKGLMAIADDISNLGGGEGGPLADVVKTLVAAAGPSAEGTLGDAIFAYDNASQPVQNTAKMGIPNRGQTGATSKKSKLAFSGSGGVNMGKKFADAVAQTLRTKAPGAVKFLDPQDLVESMMKVPLKQLVRAWGAYNGMVSHYVDNEFLMKMSKQPGGLWNALKGVANAFMGGGMAPSGRR